MLTTDASRLADGRIGVSLALPAGQAFDQGDRELAVISFTVAAGGTDRLTSVRCDDRPLARQITGVTGGVLTATFLDGGVLLGDPPIVRPPRRRIAGSSP